VKPLPPELIESRPGIEDLGYSHPTPGIGRPPARYTRAVHEHIVKCIKEGAYPEVAAASAGIGRPEFNEWMRMGREGNVHLAQFAIDVDKAEANLEIDTVKSLTDKDSPFRDPKFLTERRFANRWSPKVTTVVQGEIEGILEKLKVGLTEAEYTKVLAILAR
jgi:hypothetical protein